MSVQALADYTFQSRYSQYCHDLERKETWEEAVDRIFDMHRTKYSEEISQSQELKDLVDFAHKEYKKKRVIGSQRNLQFGGEPTLRHNLKSFNCTYTLVDRPRVFQEILFTLLCGSGVGASVRNRHINLLPNLQKRTKTIKKFEIEDSIEGWADAVGVLYSSFLDSSKGVFPEFSGHLIDFDFSKIRPKGALIANRFKAPGPNGLKQSLQKVERLLESRIEDGFLRPIDCYDVIAHISDAVLSGGIRRSALIILFDQDDDEMMNAKTGDWFVKNPQRARSNNSACVVRQTCTKEQFNKLIECAREQGEPGFFFCDEKDLHSGANPCLEISLYPKTESGESGFSACNLSEINGKFSKDEETFYKQCKAASIIGTLQAGYTNFEYLGKATEEIIEKEALLGVSITGLMDNPEILFDPNIQKRGAEIVKDINNKVAKLLKINPAARTTCIKPSGSASILLESASGIHPHHARRYLRRIQSNEEESALSFFRSHNPLAVEKSVWSATGTDYSVIFPCEVPKGAIVNNQLSALEFLEKIKSTQLNWVKTGTNKELCAIPYLEHNVSSTVTVKDDEWKDVADFLYDNRYHFTGVSLLSMSGDLDYHQSPRASVLTPNEMVKEYGDASVFASGLIVDGLAAFDNNLWAACDAALGVGENIDNQISEPQYPITRNYKDLSLYFEKRAEYEKWFAKNDWTRRLKQFAERYFDGDLRRATYCCKHVSLWKTWVDLRREYKEVDWTQMRADPEYKNADEQAAAACSGGACEIV